jgi:hypothetical protein
MNSIRLPRCLAFLLSFFSLSLAGIASVSGVEPATGHLWSQIKGDTYEQREHFAQGVQQMSAQLGGQIDALLAKRSKMTTDTSDWDFAFKEVESSRDLFAGRINELSKAKTPETWADAKEKIGEAWHRSQLAVDQMNTTRTS